MPALILDAFVAVYQAICFPVYGIPRVKRGDFIVMDRGQLKYLNWIERWNCVYCEYFNGLIGYVREIASRTEQYWCPIKHARKFSGRHGRCHRFADYGDAEDYQKRLDDLRQELRDLI